MEVQLGVELKRDLVGGCPRFLCAAFVCLFGGEWQLLVRGMVAHALNCALFCAAVSRARMSHSPRAGVSGMDLRVRV